jgi:hypothetical protein
MANAPRSSQELGDEFFLMIGNCITQWAHVQDEIFEICRQCLGCSRQNAAIVYYRTPTIDARMSLADELVALALPTRLRKSGGHDHPDLKKWKKIRDQFDALTTPRNQLAHHPVWFRVAGLFQSEPARMPRQQTSHLGLRSTLGETSVSGAAQRNTNLFASAICGFI